jgi:hypothetical protein
VHSASYDSSNKYPDDSTTYVLVRINREKEHGELA